LSYLALAGDTDVIVIRPAGEKYILAVSIPAKQADIATDALAQAANMLNPKSH
jgi:hypothetical protein